MTQMPKLKFQAEYNEIMSEAHSRPPFDIPENYNVFYLAFSCSQVTAQHVRMLIDSKAKDSGHRHVIGSLNGWVAKYELHTEFISLYLLVENTLSKDDILARLANKINFDELEINLAIWLQVASTKKEFRKIFSNWSVYYGGGLREGGEVRATLAPDDAGFIDFAVLKGSAKAFTLGRRIQRLIELETYRVMTLKGLPLARSRGVELTKLETKLESISASLNSVAHGDGHKSEDVFKELCALSNKANHIQSGSRFRYSASRAYFDLVEQRIDWFDETKVGGLHMLSAFVRSRLRPAIDTIESTGKRQQDLVDDVARVFALLRTRIELNVGKDNQDILRSMSERHDQQVKISQTVEGLSAIAITYYAVGLVSYFLKVFAKEEVVPLSHGMMTALSIPIVFGLVILGLRHMRSKWH